MIFIILIGWLSVGYTAAGTVYRYFWWEFPTRKMGFGYKVLGVFLTLLGLSSVLGVTFARKWKYGIEWKWPFI